MSDPRKSEDFQPELYPSLEGKSAPLAAKELDKTTQRKLQVLAAYYRVNLCYQKLLAVRKAGLADRSALQALEKALLARDRLDDQFAPYGMVSSPEVKNGLITNVRFTAREKQERGFSTLSMCFAVAPQ